MVALAAGNLQVTTTVRSADVGLIRVGMAVEILDEVTNATAAGTVTSLSKDPVTSSDGSLGYPAVIRGVKALPATLTGSNVRLTFTAAATAGNVLVVPVAAVSADATGSARVQMLDGNGVLTDISVVAGLSADGFIQITPSTPSSLRAGDAVVVGR